MRTFWLSMHVAYRCRHAGACCSAQWPIPLERPRVAALRVLRGDGSWLLPAEGAPADVAGVLAVSADGHCVFHRDGCEIQHALGHAALPSACQHFPREVVLDPRGVSVSLSHFCPTAADLLFDHTGPVTIVEGPPAVPSGEPEGLDARDVLPPLLTAGVLMDLDGYSAWEAHTIRVLTRDDGESPDAALGVLEEDLAILQRWRPGGVPLAAEVTRLSERGPVPGGVRSRHPGSGHDIVIIRRYLAARAFASWMAYQGGGVAAVLHTLRFALTLLREQMTQLPLRAAIRETDRQLLHLMPRDELARHVGVGAR